MSPTIGFPPRADLARKCRLGLLRISESSGDWTSRPRVHIHSHHVFPFPVLHTHAFCLLPTLRRPLFLGAPATRGDAVGRPGLKKFPAGLRLAGSQLHRTPKSQTATGSSQRCELQVPGSPARAPASPAPSTGEACESAKSACHWSLRPVSHLGSTEGRVGGGDPDPERLKGGSGGRRHRRGERSGACPSPGPK